MMGRKKITANSWKSLPDSEAIIAPEQDYRHINDLRPGEEPHSPDLPAHIIIRNTKSLFKLTNLWGCLLHTDR